MRKISLIAAAVAMTAGSLTADIQIGKGLTVGGFIDMAYTNVSKDTAGVSADTAGFNVATAEFDFGMDFGNGLTATIDLEGNVGNDDSAANVGDVEVEQARIDYAYGQSTVTLGKFNTFIGLESIEAPEMYQFSNSLTTALVPTQHEGLSYAYNGGMWNVAAALVNGLGSDNNNANTTTSGTGDKDSLSYAFHVGVTPTDALSLNLNYAMGDDEATSADAVTLTLPGIADTTLWTIDASYANHGWTVGAEYVSLEEEVTTNEVETKAWMLMANYMFTERFGLTARYSESEAESNAAAAVSVDTDEITLAASYAMTPNWSAVLEYQQLEVKNGTETDTIALESILTF